MPEAPVMTDPFTEAAQRLQTLTKVMTTKAQIAQTPKELVWALSAALVPTGTLACGIFGIVIEKQLQPL